MDYLNFTAIDFETATNFRHSICQIGICRVENGSTVFSESILVQPPNNEYSHWNIGIHGISPDRTQDKPLFSEIWHEIRLHFDNQLVVAHNADFDLDCLFKTLKFYGLDFPVLKSECTYKISGLNLIDLAEALEIPLLTHHDALNDSLLCAESYIKLKKGHKPDLQKITPKASKSIFAGHEKISGNVLKPDLENADSSSPFYNKKIVFTGILDAIGREQAAEVVKKMGADIDSGISKKTDFVIVGTGAGPSKLKKIQDYNNSGSNIKMIYEAEFLEIINQWKS
jgi:DNA polymerase-3 subunit epsilon